MGWTYMSQGNRTAREIVTELYTSEGKFKVLDVAIVNLRTAYVAYQHIPTGNIKAGVCLLGYAPKDRFNFGYKDMDETMEPSESQCPERILKLLTPTTDEYALQWRERCRQYHEQRKSKPKPKNGDTIKFSKPIKFSNGAELDTFKVVVEGRKTRFWNCFQHYQITKWRERNFEIITEETAGINAL